MARVGADIAKQKEIASIGPKAPVRPDPPNKIERAVRKATPRDRKDALDWFRTKIKGELGADGRAKSRLRRIPDSAFSPARDPFIGQMFFYIYDAKHKDKLPYWDAFPLVIPIAHYENGFLGLNLHYLPPMARAKLLDLLIQRTKYANSSRAYMKISYEILKSAAQYKDFQVCVKRYLTGHIRSNLVKVGKEFWERAALLPVQEFQKKSDREVWNASMGRKTQRKRLVK